MGRKMQTSIVNRQRYNVDSIKRKKRKNTSKANSLLLVLIKQIAIKEVNKMNREKCLILKYFNLYKLFILGKQPTTKHIRRNILNKMDCSKR